MHDIIRRAVKYLAPHKGVDIILYIINGWVVDPANGTDKPLDIKIENGKISALGSFKEIPPDAEIIDAKSCWVTPGFIDVHVHLREPGQSYKETVETGTRAAAAGGFTAVCCMPNTTPYTDSPETVEWIVNRAREVGGGVNVLPVGGITKEQKGIELARLAEMVSAGARAFSEDGKSVQDEALMREAFKLAASLGVPVLSHCEDASAKNLSPEAEYLFVERDIRLARETGTRLHICHVSAKESVEIVRNAKAAGAQNVTAEVCPHHFAFCEEDIPEGKDNGRFKMNPPLRSRADRDALLEGLRDGTLSVIATDHAPHSREEKSKGMAGSSFGVVGLETAAAAGITFLVNKNIMTRAGLIAAMTVNPARLLGIDRGNLSVGKTADVTVIDPNLNVLVDSANFLSKGRSTPFEGLQLKGKIRYTVVNGTIGFKDGDINGN